MEAQQKTDQRELRCECLAPLDGLKEGQIVGSVTEANGRVDIMSTRGWTPAPVGTPLAVGSVLETGASSDVSLTIKRCTLKVGAQTRVTVRPADKMLCVALDGTRPHISPVALGFAGGLVGLGAIIAISNGDSSPYSP